MPENFAAMVALANLVVTLGGGYGILITIKSRQAVQDVLLEHLTQTISRLDKTVEALRRGDGWIQAPPHREVDREYKS